MKQTINRPNINIDGYNDPKCWSWMKFKGRGRDFEVGLNWFSEGFIKEV